MMKMYPQYDEQWQIQQKKELTDVLGMVLVLQCIRSTTSSSEKGFTPQMGCGLIKWIGCFNVAEEPIKLLSFHRVSQTVQWTIRYGFR